MTPRTEAGSEAVTRRVPPVSRGSMAVSTAMRQAPRSRQAIPALALSALPRVAKLRQKAPFLLQKLALRAPPRIGRRLLRRRAWPRECAQVRLARSGVPLSLRISVPMPNEPASRTPSAIPAATATAGIQLGLWAAARFLCPAQPCQGGRGERGLQRFLVFDIGGEVRIGRDLGRNAACFLRGERAVDEGLQTVGRDGHTGFDRGVSPQCHNRAKRRCHGMAGGPRGIRTRFNVREGCY